MFLSRISLTCPRLIEHKVLSVFLMNLYIQIYQNICGQKVFHMGSRSFFKILVTVQLYYHFSKN